MEKFKSQDLILTVAIKNRGGEGVRGRKRLKLSRENEILTFKIGIKREIKIQRNSRIKT
jgi:hypothetical protein